MIVFTGPLTSERLYVVWAVIFGGAYIWRCLEKPIDEGAYFGNFTVDFLDVKNAQNTILIIVTFPRAYLIYSLP